ncbi:MAG TPA: tetratricopeptide repeat protein [Bacteroidia bacterium]|jgi:hypothetical protein|nr:tetratricopeptide repeat protein [Bacteroidia bacterium]
MFGIFENLYEYYYLVLILQGICVFHSIRKGNQSKWIWIIVFLPLIGCIAYLFTEIIKRRHVSSLQEGMATLVNPGGRIKDLEKKFTFSDTHANRVALADAYLESGLYEKAAELYEPTLKGMFYDNEHVVKQLIIAYHHLGKPEKLIEIAPRIKNVVDFSTSKSNLLYALALEQTGKFDLAEKEYKAMNHRFSNYEARYQYGDFLLHLNRKEDAALIFNDMVEEAEQMNRKEKGNNTIWIDKAKTELKRILA